MSIYSWRMSKTTSDQPKKRYLCCYIYTYR